MLRHILAEHILDEYSALRQYSTPLAKNEKKLLFLLNKNDYMIIII